MQFVAEAGWVPTSASALPPLRVMQPRRFVDAVAMMADAERPLPLAGGTDLVAAFNEGVAARELIDLSRLDELRCINGDGDRLCIGAAVTHDAGSRSETVRVRTRGFAQAWSRIANPRIRFSGTLGGNLMARRVRYEGSILLSALDARLRFATVGGEADGTPAQLWTQSVPGRALLRSIDIDTAGLLWFGYERSLRPLMTLAVALRRSDGPIELVCAVATEYLAPVTSRGTLPNLSVLASSEGARAAAADLFAQLPDSFADPVLDARYARRTGAVLLARQLQGAARG